MARVRRQIESRALNEAKKVPWRILAEAADEYTDWQIFALWLRAVLDSCDTPPPEIALETQNRSPILLTRIASYLHENASPLGFRIWEEVIYWVEANVFAEAKLGKWLNAVRYFSSSSLLSMKAWSYWEEVDERWRAARPQPVPDYEQWRHSALSVTRLSNPEGDIQMVIDSVRSISAPRWEQLFGAFMDLTTLCLWIEILLGMGSTGEELVVRELARLYPSFDASSIKNSNSPISLLTEWVFTHAAQFADIESLLPALSYHVKYHPAYHARRSFAGCCRELWSNGHLVPPSFADWTKEADSYFER